MNILNVWGYDRGFIVAMCPSGNLESDRPPGSKRWKQVQAFWKGIHGKLNPDLDFIVTFDPDADKFIASIVRDNKV